MVKIDFMDKLNNELNDLVDDEFNKYAERSGLKSNYSKFNFVAREENKVVGIVNGYSGYGEVHIDTLIVVEEYRKHNIGSLLIEKVEKYFKNSYFENINLNTYGFQAPGFYEKMGYVLEYVRRNPINSKLDKYFYSKKIR